MKRKALHFFVILLCILSNKSVFAQGATIYGPLFVTPGEVALYEVGWDSPPHPYSIVSLNVQGGTILSQSLNPTGSVYCYVQWDNAPGSGSVEVAEDIYGMFGGISVMINEALGAGWIESDYLHFNASVNQPAITQSSAAGGYCYQSYNYTWEHSTDGVVWNAVGYGEIYPYNAPALTTRTFIRRKVDCNTHTLYSNTLEFTYQANNWENRNYVRTNEIWYPGKYTFEAADMLPIGQKQQNTVYFDGLARQEQSISMQASPTKKDFVSFNEYDPFGRETKKYLTYQATDGAGLFKPNANAEQLSAMGDPVTGKYIGESHFYAETQFENNLLNKPIKTLAPGLNWGGSNLGIETTYDFNGPQDNVRIWRIDQFAIGAIPLSGSNDLYPVGTLSKTIVKDERGRLLIEYKDSDERTILKKQQLKDVGPELTEAHGGWLCTYYVYDDLGRLRFTITPKAVAKMDESGNWAITQAMANGLCYIYSYDSKGRMIEKKLPDADPARMVFDARDRLVLTQDGNQASGTTNPGNYKEWTYNVYDDMNRQVLTGVMRENSNYTRATLQAAVDNQSITGNVSLNFTTGATTEALWVNRPIPLFTGLPSTISYVQHIVYQITRFDEQNATLYLAETFGYPNNSENIETGVASNRTKGMQTSAKVRVLGDQDSYLAAYTIYDEKGRVLYTYKAALDDFGTSLHNQYDFAGKIRSTKFSESYAVPPSPPGIFTTRHYHNIVTKNELDHAGRLTKTFKNFTYLKTPTVVGQSNGFSSGEKLVAEYVYDDFGQLATKTLAPGYNGPHGAWMEKLNYTYNIRGWMTGINKDYVNNSSASGSFFGMEIGYDKPGTAGFANPIKNGNIAGVAWKTAGDNTPRKFDYQYDIASRLTNANFTQRNDFGSPGNWTKDKHDFSVPVIQYDANGNITRMEQQGVTFSGIIPMDKLSYDYSETSNKLNWVAEDLGPADNKLGDFTDRNAGIGNTDYLYDANGNVTVDKNRGIESIRYNFLNLPELIKVTGKGTIEYIYDAAGNKLRKKITDNTLSPTTVKQTTYNGAVTREGNSIVIGFEEGRVRAKPEGAPTQFVFDYFVRDYQQNTRMVLTEETSVNYYPAATMETAAAPNEELYYNITDRSDKPAELQGNAAYDTRYGQKMNRLSSLTGSKRIGPSILLKVMAGDMVHAKTDYYYKDNGPQINAGNMANDLAANLLTHLLLGQAGGAAKSQASLIQSSVAGDGIVSSLITQQNTEAVTSRPKAFLNYIVFDEQMKAVKKGTLQVQASGPLQAPLPLTDISIDKNGWIYVFTNNESEQSVYFDNFQVTHGKGNIMEETHYYPFGLTMKAISPRALNTTPINRTKYNGKELQSEEFSDGTSLEEYDYGARFYDPQIGRWHVIDPLAEDFYNISPYSYAANNPLLYKDKDGKFLNLILQYGINVGINIATQMLTAMLFDPEVKLWDFSAAWDKVSIWDALWEGGVDMISSKKLQMAINGVTQMFTYIDQVGLENATVTGLLGAGAMGILEPIVGDAIGKYGIKRVEQIMQKKGMSEDLINTLLGRPKKMESCACGNICFASDTKVRTTDSLLNIIDIKVGTLIWNYDSTTQADLNIVPAISRKVSVQKQGLEISSATAKVGDVARFRVKSDNNNKPLQYKEKPVTRDKRSVGSVPASAVSQRRDTNRKTGQTH